MLFRRFEGVNGPRDPRATTLFDAVLSALTVDQLVALAERHRLDVDFDPGEPPRYATTGGSDDHSGIYVATTWTETACWDTLLDMSGPEGIYAVALLAQEKGLAPTDHTRVLPASMHELTCARG